MQLILTCEHASNAIPTEFKPLFKSASEILKTHRGFDIGALSIANILADYFEVPLYAGIYSRLLIDLNRSLKNRAVFSEFTCNLPKTIKQEIIEKYYFPHRKLVTEQIQQQINKKNSVLHLAIHSFTPELNNKTRNNRVGLLYCANRVTEKEFCTLWRTHLITVNPDVSVRFNFPYRGGSDGFPTTLRQHFPQNYLGIEVELNQKHLASLAEKKHIAKIICESLKKIIF